MTQEEAKSEAPGYWTDSYTLHVYDKKKSVLCVYSEQVKSKKAAKKEAKGAAKAAKKEERKVQVVSQ